MRWAMRAAAASVSSRCDGSTDILGAIKKADS
jgi:hypothetical protein